MKGLMKDFQENSQHIFNVTGINHHNAPVQVRERFALSDKDIKQLLNEAKKLKINGLLVVSTCNRTEMYTFSENKEQLTKLLLEYCQGTGQEFSEHVFHLTGDEAVKQLFEVGVGLDSQILGDYQIIGQVKAAYKLSVEANMMPPVFSRMLQYVFQASREVKNKTELSTGSASVATYAAKYIEQQTRKSTIEKILLYGLGKIGVTTIQNLLRSEHHYEVSVMNRTYDRSLEIAKKYGLQAVPVTSMAKEIKKHRIFVVSTGAPHYTIDKELSPYFMEESVILDLSIPRNVDPALAENKKISIKAIDEISQQKTNTLKTREKHIADAGEIVMKKIKDYNNWLSVNHVSPVFNELRKKLYQYKQAEIKAISKDISNGNIDHIDQVSNNIINKIIQNFLIAVRKNPEKAAEVHEFIRKSFGLKDGEV
jgi:glutamyl-tRNA reductase